MKQLTGAMLLAAGILLAAPPNPVQWKIAGVPAKPVKPGARFAVKLTARIDQGWHLYSMKHLADGPIATRIWLPEGQPFQLAGVVGAPPPESVQDPNFNMEVEFYQGEQVFMLPVRVAAAAASGLQNLQVNTSYQSCNDKLCLPPRTIVVEVPVEVKK